jgi:hypothetical protein
VGKTCEVYDIIFDFTNITKGGGLVRLIAYINYFKNSDIKVAFLLHKNNKLKLPDNSKIIYINKSPLEKVLLLNGYLKQFEGSKWLFSYGAPIPNKKYIKSTWLHLNNAIPFYLFRSGREGEITLSLYLSVKSHLQLLQFKLNNSFCDVISAESEYTLLGYVKSIPKSKFSRLIKLFNCMPALIAPSTSNYRNYAITVGTYSYKRIDDVYNVYKSQKKLFNLNNLIIVGDEKFVSSTIKNQSDVIFSSNLSEKDYINLLAGSSCYITASEIENSPCSTLEALYYSKVSILSAIPAHKELIRVANYKELLINNKKYFLIRSNIDLANMPNWNDEIIKLLTNMNLYRPLTK